MDGNLLPWENGWKNVGQSPFPSIHPFQKNGLCFGSSREESFSRWWFHFFFHPHLGKTPSLTDIFQMGWNHQPVLIFSKPSFFQCETKPPGGCESWSRQFGWAPEAEQLVLDLGILANDQKNIFKKHRIYSEDHLRIIRFLQPQTVGSKKILFSHFICIQIYIDFLILQSLAGKGSYNLIRMDG